MLEKDLESIAFAGFRHYLAAPEKAARQVWEGAPMLRERWHSIAFAMLEKQKHLAAKQKHKEEDITKEVPIGSKHGPGCPCPECAPMVSDTRGPRGHWPNCKCLDCTP